MKVDYNQLDHINKKLKEVLDDLENTFRVEFTNTSNYRPGDEGVHGYGRGWDIACSYDPLGELVEKYINDTWIYDRTRPGLSCCMYHDNRINNGKHIHIQVHRNTVRRF